MPRQVDSREKLLRTASELISVGSYNSTSVDQICAACGIKKGSFYHHFASKEQLTTEALEVGWKHFQTALDRAFSPLIPPLERIRTFLKTDCERQRALHLSRGRVCGCPIFALGAEISTQEPVLRSKVEELLSRVAKYFESTIREAHALGEIDAPDAKKTAWQVLTFWEGAMTLSRIRDDLQPVIDSEDAIFRILRPKHAPAAA